MKRRDSLHLDPTINIANLIDIMFSILVVFMITAPLMSQGVKVDLPKAQAASLDEKKAVNVTVTKEREIIINEIPSTSEEFRKDFRTAWTGDPEVVVVVNSDRTVPYGFIMTLVAEAQHEGAKRFGFLTDPSGYKSSINSTKRRNR